jgi:Kef-type K+ transport system membrane component KefB
MPTLSFGGLLAVVAVAFLAPLLLGLVPRIRLPAVVLEIVAGIVIGPSVFGWVRVDLPIQVLSLIGLGFLLFLAGMEIELDRLRGSVLRRAGGGFLLSIILAAATAGIATGLGLVKTPVLLAIILLATSLGLVVPVLKDAGETSTPLGRLTIAGASIGDFGAVILLSLFFSRESTSAGPRVVLLGGFVLVAALVVLTLGRVGRSMRLANVLVRLQDTTAEIRVRGAILLLIAFVALAERLGLETILGAFMAGAALRLLDRDVMRTHPNFRVKLEAVGYGFFIPIFFISSGLQFDLRALVASGATLLHLPIFLLALLIVRGVPAVLYRSTIGTRRAVAAGLLQATSLPFIVAATMIGLQLGLITAANEAALIGAGLVSVVMFPALSLTMLRPKVGAPSTEPDVARL